ncbi:restriction endonuclease subunit S [Helicobacter bizzozeronii]|uniref:restriction endonuclease subunit S n=1 Tax=Helicobacter bizzozeronii TaxID=56877 RepID=UPI0003178585|nr:restriction endonuclease subunit S [Helicobacter bizzozeronii]
MQNTFLNTQAPSLPNQTAQRLLSYAVEFVTIKEICRIGRGRVIDQKYIREHMGDYPVYSSQTRDNGILGYIDTYDFDGELVTWTTDGYAGVCFYRSGKFSCTNVCGTLKVINTNEVSPKFLAYILNLITPSHVTKTAIPKLMNNVMANIKIPLPPLCVQEKIVKILEPLSVLSGEC